MKKKNMDALESITGEQALEILRTLLKESPSIRKKIGGLAAAMAAEVSWEDVAASVFFHLDMLDVEDLWHDAGGGRYGYRGTDEIADDMIKGAIKDALDESERYEKSGMEAAWVETVKGLIKGLYDFDQGSKTQFREWAVDLSLNNAQQVLNGFKTSPKSRKHLRDVHNFLARECPEWQGNGWLE